MVPSLTTSSRSDSGRMTEPDALGCPAFFKGFAANGCRVRGVTNTPWAWDAI